MKSSAPVTIEQLARTAKSFASQRFTCIGSSYRFFVPDKKEKVALLEAQKTPQRKPAGKVTTQRDGYARGAGYYRAQRPAE
jgi:hypothetical protein